MRSYILLSALVSAQLIFSIVLADPQDGSGNNLQYQKEQSKEAKRRKQEQEREDRKRQHEIDREERRRYEAMQRARRRHEREESR